MHYTKTIPLATLLLSAPFASADDLGGEDVPQACTDICKPIRQLVRQCDVDDDRVGGDRNENRLERQCICTNDSFDVAKVAGLCQSCIQEHWDDGCIDSDSDDSDDDDDVEDCDDGRKAMRKIMRACNFSSVSYDAKATSTDVSVSASPYTDVAQLSSATESSSSASTTTTTTTSGGARETGSTGNSSDGDDADDDNTNTSNDKDGDTDNQNDGDDDSAAGRAAVPGVAAVFGLIAAGVLA